MKIAIVDDEKEFTDYFTKIVGNEFCKHKENIKIDCFNSLGEYLMSIATYDYLFLDIMFGESSILDEYHKVINKCEITKVIFVTGNEEMTYATSHVSPFDCLHKNKIDEELFKLISRIVGNYHLNTYYFTFKIYGRDRKIRFRNIVYFEANINEIEIHLVGGQILKTRSTLKRIQEELKLQNIKEFIKINKSIIINITNSTDFTNAEVLMRGNIKLPLAINKKALIKNELISRLIEVY